MKSINIITEYTDYITKCLKKISKLLLEKYYVEEDFSKLLNIYIRVRYYDSLERKNKSPYFNTKMYVKDELLKLENDKSVLEPVLKIYNEIMNLEQSNIKAKELINNTLEYRKTLKLSSDKYINELITLCDEMNKKKREIQKAFASKEFFCNYKSTNVYKAFIVQLDYSFSIPKLYSDFAVNKVYTSGIVNEDKLFVEYHLINCKLLNQILSFDFSNNYIVEFASSLLEKESKLHKLLDIVNNDICKEKISLMISFTDFERYRDKILGFINDGFNFAIVIDNNYVDSLENQKLISSVFKYIIISSSNKNIDIFKQSSNLIKIK